MSKKQKDTYSYKGWLNSDSFLKRAFGVLGYYFSAYFFLLGIVIFIWLIFFIIGLIFVL